MITLNCRIDETKVRVRDWAQRKEVTDGDPYHFYSWTPAEKFKNKARCIKFCANKTTTPIKSCLAVCKLEDTLLIQIEASFLIKNAFKVNCAMLLCFLLRICFPKTSSSHSAVRDFMNAAL